MPRAKSDEKDITMTFRLCDKVKTKLEYLCRQSYRTKTDEIIRLIDREYACIKFEKEER